MNKIKGLFLLLVTTSVLGQSLSIAVEDTVCVNNTPIINNTSVGMDSIQWDFCPGELVNTPEFSTQYNIPADNIGLDEIQTFTDGSNYYSFILSNTNNELYRVTIGDSLTDTPALFEDFGNVGALSNPRRISGIKEGSTWYLFITNFIGNSISRISFGNDISGAIQADDNLGNINGELNGPFAIEALELGGTYYLIVGNHISKEIKVFDYGSSYSNAPALINNFTATSDIGNLSEIKTVKINNSINLVVCGQSKAFVYDFEGTDFSNSPLLLYDLSTFGSMSSPRGFDVLHDNGNIFINFIGFSGDYYSYQFDNSWNFIEFNDYGVFSGLTDTRSLEFNFQNSQWIGYSVNRSSDHELFQISYPDNCRATTPSTNESVPSTSAYDTLGWQFLTVDGFADGFRFHHKDSVFVQGMTGVNFTTSVSCVGVADFTSGLTSLGDVTFNYSWDFDDPGSGASNTSVDANPTHTYNTPGDYNVFLSVTDECGVTLETTKVVTVFDQNDMDPGFEVATALLCSNSLIQFNDTTTFTSDVPQAWAWYIDDVLVSNNQNPELTFTSSGTFRVELEVTGLSTCVKTVERMFNIEEGPSVDVSFSNNCFGEVVQFNTAVIGDDSGGYSWDLDGDDIEDSTSPNPTFTYPSSTTYPVTLQVSNAIGCLTEVTFNLEVPDNNFLDFTIGEAVENLAVELNGLDQTISSDSIVSWDWLIDGSITSSAQDTSVVFNTPGTYEARLTATSAQGCVEIEIKDIVVGAAISPTSIFNVDESGCLNQTITISNSTVNATSYLWDFCLEDFTEEPVLSTTELTGVGTLYGYELLQENGNWYGFLTERDAGVMYRLDFGDSPLNTPTLNSLGNPFNLLETPTGIDFVNENGTWHCFVGFFNNSLDIVRLDFEDGLNNNPTNGVPLGNFGVSGRIRDIEIALDNGSYYLLIPSYSFNTITVVNFGNSVRNTVPSENIITTGAIANAVNLNGISSVEINGNWYVIVGSLSNSNIHQLNFGSSLFNSNPTQDTTYTFASVDRPFRFDIIQNGNDHFVLIGNDGIPFSIIDFNDFTQAPTEIDNTGFPLIYGIDAIKFNGEYIIQGGFSANHQSALFTKDCATDQGSTEFSPTITYSNPGEFVIELESTNEIGNSSILRDTITITSDAAPVIELTIDENRCITNYNTFTPSITGLTSYSWDFDDDGMEDSNEENPQVLFDTLGGPGTYLVRVDVNDGTCDNFYEEEITIYPEPPTPTFDSSFPALCENVTFNFSNTIDSSGYNGIMEYRWFLNGSEISTDRDLDLSFDTPGEKIIGLQAHIPGCESTIVQDTFNITLAPIADFQADTICLSETLFLTNNSSNASTYSWDFGDGETSTLIEPTKVYADTGTFQITLVAIDASGDCNDTQIQTVRVNRNPPTPTFDIESIPFCIGSEISLSNTTTDGPFNSEVTYVWTVTDLGEFTSKDVNLTFAESGQKTIQLKSIYRSCESTVASQVIEVNDLPTPNFSATSVCQDESMQFTNQSTNAVSYLWDFGDGFTSTSENPSHVYTAAGNYDVSLIATSANGCDSEIIIEVSVSDIPQVNFDFEVPCNTESGVSFTDLSTVNNADIVGWQWYVEGIEVSTEQNPTLNFAETGVINVSLAVTSSNGCESTYNEDIEIQSSPSPDFSSTIGCVGEETSFDDMTVSSSTIISWLWFVDGVSYTTENVSHVFDDYGSYEVSLEVTSQNFCAESITKTIEILQPPTIDFSIDGDCNNVLIEVLDLSTEFNDPIISRTWRLNDEEVGNGGLLYLNQLESDSYTLTLEVQTESGCVNSMSQPLEINDSPNSSFTSSRSYGLPNDQLTFTNTSNGATSFQWLFDGEPAGNDPNAETYLFSEAGTHIVGLVALNSLGCVDTTNQEILIEVPEIDLSIGSFDLVQENNTGKIFLEIQNLSNLPVESFEAQIVLENQFTVTEQINTFIDIGKTTLVSLNVGIPLVTSEPAYFCVSLSSPYADYEDLNPIDNEKCLTIQPKVRVEDPFPNPVSDEFRLKVIVPNEGAVKLTLLNSAGKIQTERIYNASTGLNNFIFDMSLLDPGIYYITVDVNGELTQRKVIKL